MVSWSNLMAVYSRCSSAGKRIPDSGFPEPLFPQETRIARSAGPTVRRGVVTGRGPCKIQSERRCLRHDPGFRGEVRGPLEGFQELGSAVGVARVVEGVRPDVDVPGADGLSPRDRVRQ